MTFFTDSAVYPALSPDGRMLAFIRGNSAFFWRREIYVKLLPSGDAVQLTHDPLRKLGPTFSPDGSRIAYGTVGPWDTWEVPVLGRQPNVLLRNASSLTWIDNGKHLLFSRSSRGCTWRWSRLTRLEGKAVTSTFLLANAAWFTIPISLPMVVGVDGGHGQPGPLVAVPGISVRWQRRRACGRPANATCIAGAWSPDASGSTSVSNPGGPFHICDRSFPTGHCNK